MLTHAAFANTTSSGEDTAQLRFALITTEAELTDLAPQWADLLQRSDCNELMLSPAWLLTWWDIYGRDSGRDLRVGAWYLGDRLCGLALLQLRRIRYRGMVPFRRLEWVGADMEIQDGVASEYLNLIAERGMGVRVCDAFAAALTAGAFGGWDELIFDMFDGQHPRLQQLADALAKQKLTLDRTEAMPAPYIPLPTSWDEYLNQMGKRKRQVVKVESDLKEWAQGTFERHQATTPETLAQGQEILRKLNAERWQSAGRAGVFEADRFARFHDKVMSEFLRSGQLDLRWHMANGEAVGVQYGIRWNDKLYFYQTGRKMDLPSKVRAGIAIIADGIRAAMEAGLREYDFLGGAALYKTQLALASRPLLRLRIHRRSIRELLRRGLEYSIDQARAVRTYWRSRRQPSSGTEPPQGTET